MKTDNWSMGNNSVEDIGQQLQLQPDGIYAELSTGAHAGCGGPENIEIYQTFKVKNVPTVMSVTQIIRKLISQTKVVQNCIDFMEQFEANSNLHFVCTRIFVPLIEFGDSVTEIS